MATETGLLKVSLDFVFKLIFGDQKNADITQNFLSAVLNLPEEEFVSLKFTNTELKRKFKDDKLSVLDVRDETAKNSDIAIEIQVLSDFWDKFCYPNNYIILKSFKKPLKTAV